MCSFANQRVLDLGCGTGVLGVLASRWGASSVDFADLDPDAVRATRASCRLNGVSPGAILRSDLLLRIRARYDVVLGNLYADLVLRLASDPRLGRSCRIGTLILSGIHRQRLITVRASVRAAGFAIQAEARDGQWHGLRLRR